MRLSKNLGMEFIHNKGFELYQQAEQAFWNCIKCDDNVFLESEIKYPIDELRINFEFIQLKFDKLDFENFLIEVRINIKSPLDEELGYYSNILNRNFERIDDYLVFLDSKG